MNKSAVLVLSALALALAGAGCESETQKAAEQGDAVAQAALGFSYATGDGVPQDDGEAVRWYRLAAAQGNAMCSIHPGRRLRHRPGRAAGRR